MRGLYAIVDVLSLQARDLHPLRFAEALLSAHPAALQLRDKRRDARSCLSLLQSLAPLCRAEAVPLFANDRPDLAALAGCDGVHLGQQDVPPSLARELFSQLGLPRPAIGMSVHNEAELAKALKEEPDYLALGPVFATTSKERPDPQLGLEGLDMLLAALGNDEGPPTVAIGGITEEHGPAIAQRCRAGAVIAALLPETTVGDDAYREVAARARRLHASLGGGGAS